MQYIKPKISVQYIMQHAYMGPGLGLAGKRSMDLL